MNLLKFTIDLAKKAGEIIEKEKKLGLKITEKRKHDLVTNADKASEKFIIEEIKKKFPDHEILAEESSFKNPAKIKNLTKAPYIWIIDPLDGTTNFAHGLPLYSVSIAVLKNKGAESSNNFEYVEGEIVVGVVFAPALNEMFYAEKSKGAYLNNKKIQVSDIENVDQSLAVTGFPYENKETNLPYFKLMLNKAQAVRRLGSAAIDLCYTAAGRFDFYWEFGLKPWDIAAGSLIVKEAGGKVTDTNGNLLDLFGEDILASNGKTHEEVVKMFSTL